MVVFFLFLYNISGILDHHLYHPNIYIYINDTLK